MNENQNLTWDDIKAMFAETGRRLKETEQLINKYAEENARSWQQMEKERQERREKEREKERQEREKERQEREKERERERQEREKERERERQEREKERERERQEKEKEREEERQEKEKEREEERQARKKREKERKKREEEWKKREEKKEEEYKKLRETLQYVSEEVGGIGHNNGAMAEEFFYNTFKRDKTFVNEKFDEIKRNFTYRGQDDKLKVEYDILLFNGTSAAIIEVKYNAKAKNIDIAKLISRVEVFKIWFPEYKNHKIYLGVAAMSFHKDLTWRLHRAGIATIRPVGKKMVVYDKTVKTF